MAAPNSSCLSHRHRAFAAKLLSAPVEHLLTGDYSEQRKVAVMHFFVLGYYITPYLMSYPAPYHVQVAVVHFLDHEMYLVPVFFASTHPQRALLDQWFPGRNVGRIVTATRRPSSACRVRSTHIAHEHP